MRQVRPTIGGDPASWHISPSLGRDCLVTRGLTGMLLTVCHLPMTFPASSGPGAPGTSVTLPEHPTPTQAIAF